MVVYIKKIFSIVLIVIYDVKIPFQSAIALVIVHVINVYHGHYSYFNFCSLNHITLNTSTLHPSVSILLCNCVIITFNTIVSGLPFKHFHIIVAIIAVCFPNLGQSW